MKKLLSLTGALVLLLTLLTSSAFAARQPAAQAPSPLEGKQWVLESYVDESGKTAQALPDAAATAEFKDSKVSGSTGCNTYAAPYEVKGDKLTIGMTATTMKMCAGPVMDQEAAFLKNIQAAASFKVDGGKLTIADAKGTVLLTFAAAEPVALTGKTWVMTGYNNGKDAVQSGLADVRVTAVFGDDGKLTGKGGCNNYSGAYVAKDGTLKVGQLATTMMACDQPVMDQETAYLKALQTSTTYKIEGDKLTLTNGTATQVTYVAEAPATLTGKTWLMTGYNNGKGAVQSALADVEVTVEFGTDGRLAGSGGCNRYNGAYEAKDGTIKVGQIATTMMACDPTVMDQERAYLQALQAAATYKIDGDELEIFDAKGARQVTYVAKAPLTLTGKTWEMSGYNNGKGGFQSPLAEPVVTAVFGDDGIVSGNGGCNNYSGPYEAKDGTIKAGPLVSTMMACEQPVMDQETAYLAALQKVATYQMEGTELIMRDAEGAMQVGYREAEAAAVTAAPAASPETAATPEPQVTTAVPLTDTLAVTEPVSGTLYVGILPAADASVRSFALNLKPDKTAGFLTNYGEGKLILERGTWAEDANKAVTVTLIEKNGQKLDKADVLKFARDGTYLNLTDYDKAVWGETGLRLNQSADVARKVRSAMVTIDLQAGFPLDPTFVSVNGGGQLDAGLLGRGCKGYVNLQPVVTVHWTGAAEMVRVFFLSDGDPTLVIIGPDGKLYCNDNAGKQLLDPFVQIDKPKTGDYRIWVGSTAKRDLIPGVLVMTAKQNMDLGTFQLGTLIKRPLIQQETAPVAAAQAAPQAAQPLAKALSADQLQALRQKLIEGAVALTAGQTGQADVTADGILPLFKLPDAAENGCAGLVTGTPSYAFKWTGPTDKNLRIAFEGDGDATLMVVGLNNKSVFCNDDETAGKPNPAVVISDPADDTYLVYVGRVSPDKPVTGKLTVAESAKE
jgi:heat shock protein HslJ